MYRNDVAWGYEEKTLSSSHIFLLSVAAFDEGEGVGGECGGGCA